MREKSDKRNNFAIQECCPVIFVIMNTDLFCDPLKGARLTGLDLFDSRLDFMKEIDKHLNSLNKS